MLCTLQTIAVILSIFLILVTFILLVSINKTFQENAKLKGSRIFHIPLQYDFDKTRKEPPEDVQFDLVLSPLRGTLIVDDPVEMLGIAILNSQYARNQVGFISIAFEYAQAYPIYQDEKGITRGARIVLNPTSENHKLKGSGEFIWTTEGNYRPLISFWMKNGAHQRAIGEVGVTVYPRTQIAQIITNETNIYLAVAAYIVGAVGVLNIIWRLWAGVP
jgi:hypothetical protein